MPPRTGEHTRKVQFMSGNHEHLHAMRHSLAHITASAVKKLWPEAKFGVGPLVDNGFITISILVN